MKSMKNQYKETLNFIVELGQLKRVPRSGWWTVGIENPESVADHSFRCAIIGYSIAILEKVNAERTALMCLLNDVHETRINDLHKVCQQYIDLRASETKAFNDQIKYLPSNLKSNLKKLMCELWEDDTRESVIARDADILECMIQAKEYCEQGYVQAKEFMKKSPKLLKSKTAKKFAQELQTCNTRQWIKRIVKITR